MSILNEFKTSFSKEFHTCTQYGINMLRGNCSIGTCQLQSNDHYD